MIKKISNFIVNKRYIILAIMLVLAVASIICSQFVAINEDMTIPARRFQYEGGS